MLLLFLTCSAVHAQRPLGIDVSSFQGSSVNWTNVKNSGISFAWCKATEGVTFKDTTFGINITNARNAGVLIGAYHYARPDNNLGVAGAAREATNYWNSVSNYVNNSGAYLMPVLDIEAPGVSSPTYSKATLSEWVNAWCANVTNRAFEIGVVVRPVVYTFVSYANTWIDSSVTQWPLRMAQWPANPDPQTGSPSGTAPWSTWNVWQYSSTGTVPGVSGNCDLNVFNGTLAQLQATLVIGGVSPPVFNSTLSSRYADPGSSLTFNADASGTGPLRYQWRFNGTNLPAATNGTLTLANLQLAQAGTYQVIVTNNGGAVTSVVATLTLHPLQYALFTDNFDTDTSASWTLNRSSTDNRASFAYDHGALGIPSAPGTTNGTTKALRFEANLSAGAVNALNVSPTGQSFPTNCRLRFDMWINANGPLPLGGTGSTEVVTAGVGTAGNRVQWNGAGTTADGFWFTVTGEGGVGDTSSSQGDYVAYVGTSQQGVASGVYSSGTNSTARGAGDAYYHNVFPGSQGPPAVQALAYPQQTGTLSRGTVGLAWREVIVQRTSNRAEWFIDGLKVASVTNVAPAGNNVFVGYWDPFASISDNTNLSFGLVDNLRVEVPAIAPAFTQQPAHLWAQLGGTASFTVSAIGEPAPQYQWRLNGTNLLGQTSGSLTLSNLSSADAGLYSVVASNLVGTVVSTNALLSLQASGAPTLQVSLPPPATNVLLQSLVQPGATYTLESSTNLVQWEFVSQTVASGTNLQFTPAVSAAEPQRYFRLRSGPP